MLRIDHCRCRSLTSCQQRFRIYRQSAKTGCRRRVKTFFTGSAGDVKRPPDGFLNAQKKTSPQSEER